jgi:hypothetical protein
MIDFSTLQGVTIPEGVVTQIESGGVVLWKLQSGGGPVILEVEKDTSDTYAGGTTYTGEQFILLDIYPKAGGTVSVTYGGLTKTVTDTSGADEPNAQQVYFGTFNGVSDSVATPESGTLTIEGDCAAFGAGTFAVSSKASGACDCVKAINSFGMTECIPQNAFGSLLDQCQKLTGIDIPPNIKTLGSGAFLRCTGLTRVTGLKGIVEITVSAFASCDGLKTVEIPKNVTKINGNAFYGCAGLTSVVFEDTSGWFATKKEGETSTEIALDVSDPANNATLITSTYSNAIAEDITYTWHKA